MTLHQLTHAHSINNIFVKIVSLQVSYIWYAAYDDAIMHYDFLKLVKSPPSLSIHRIILNETNPYTRFEGALSLIEIGILLI